MRDTKGITLIALIITIIVLLILAGVTIITLTGENGILKRATTAGQKTNEETAKEELKLLITEARLDLASEKQIINPKIEDIAKWIKDNYDTEIDMTITYKKTSSVIIENNGITTEIDFAEIQYKGYKFVLKKDLTIDDTKTSTSETKTYTITYDANGGEGAPTEQKKTHGYPVTLSTTIPTKTGYVFLGWSKDKTSTIAEYEKGTILTENADLTLWAIWRAETVADVISVENYGNNVNYSAKGVNDWKIFYNNESYVYIITSDFFTSRKSAKYIRIKCK